MATLWTVSSQGLSTSTSLELLLPTMISKTLTQITTKICSGYWTTTSLVWTWTSRKKQILLLNHSYQFDNFGKVEIKELKPGGKDIEVTNHNKEEYVHLICYEKMATVIKAQIEAFLEGLHDLIPKELVSIFDHRELELMISGLPEIDRKIPRSLSDMQSPTWESTRSTTITKKMTSTYSGSGRSWLNLTEKWRPISFSTWPELARCQLTALNPLSAFRDLSCSKFTKPSTLICFQHLTLGKHIFSVSENKHEPAGPSNVQD